MTMLRGLALLLGSIAALGCAPPAPPEPPVTQPLASPAATVRVLNHLAWPFRLARIVVVADGVVVRDQRFPRGAAPSSITASVPAAPGRHVVQMLAETQVSLTAGGPECAATLRSATPWVAGERPAEIGADLYLRPPPRAFADRLDVQIDVRGATRDAWPTQRLPRADEARCRLLRAPDRAICRVEAMVAEATRRRDVIEVVCNRDKLDQMRVLSRLRDEAAAQVSAAALEGPSAAPRRSPPIVWTELPPAIEPRVDAAELRDRVLVLERAIEALEREADQCIGEEPIVHGGATVTIDDACFEKALPPLDLDPVTTPR
jgi:hypothetical protein